MKFGTLILSALLAACTAAAQDKPQTASVSGQVISVATGSPIPQADLSYWVGGKSVDTKTDDAGRYKFTDLAPGSGTWSPKRQCHQCPVLVPWRAGISHWLRDRT